MIRGSDFTIRHVRRTDLPELVPLLNSPEVRGMYLPSRMTSPVDIEKMFDKDGISNEIFERFLIVDHNDKLLGTIFHFKSVPYFSAREIGYILFSDQHRNRGIVTRAVKLLVQYLFNSFQINRLEIRMDAHNLASEKVAIKCGFKKEGVARGANFVYGKYVDMNIYALLRDEAV